MSTFEFLHTLKESGVRVWLEDDRLRCTGPEQVLMSEVREQLSARKTEIIAFLRSAASSSGSRSSVVPIQPVGGRWPLFAVPGHNGDVFCYLDLARHLGTDQPFFALQAPGMEPGQDPLISMEEIAALFARDMAAVQPQGPYLLAGYCLGGTIAFELAQQLTAKGHEVSFLVLLGSACPTALAPRYRAQAAVMNIAGRFVRHGSALGQRRPSEWSQYLRERAAERRADRERERHDPLRLRLTETTVEAFKAYQPKPGSFPVHMLMPNEDPDSLLEDRPLDWSLFAKDFTVALGPADGDMNTMLLEPHVSRFAQLLEKKLREAVPPPAVPRR
ncbi:MAG TPA: alpha/beta fold hydrolase [Candidatus Dormibacteraeota bacterium]|jgi:thioesterase domain-containing protein|nr:alpha/beta fold hydrolase [Candidatus Dormibacteraeota bacterium]